MSLVMVPEKLRTILGEEGSKEFVLVLNNVEERQFSRTVEKVEDKFERRLTEEITKLDKRITEESARLDKRITEEGARLDRRISDVELKLSETKNDILKWMFAMWLTQMLAIIGLFLRKGI